MLESGEHLQALHRLLEVENEGVEPDDREDVQPDCDGVHVQHEGGRRQRKVQVPGIVELGDGGHATITGGLYKCPETPPPPPG